MIDSVRPIDPARLPEPVPRGPVEKSEPVSAAPPMPAAPRPKSRTAGPGVTLDAGWDRRLARGQVAPDCIVDLHGHSLSGAYDRLDRSLEQAISGGDRLILLITGRPPASGGRSAPRGRIRAAVGDWLAASRHASDIAAVRAAHPRHGGAGALYIILRRRRGPAG